MGLFSKRVISPEANIVSGDSAGDSGGGILDLLGGFINKNPEQFAVMADMIGKNFDPDNAFANVGTSMGQSSLANKALQEEKTDKQDWRKLIGDMISGKEPVTPAGTPGLSGATIKPSNEDGMNEVNLSLTEPIDEEQKPKTGKTNNINLGELMRSPF